MGILKVLAFALVLGFLFAALSALFIESLERIVTSKAAMLQLGVIGVGLILGAIAGATQAIVDALDRGPK